MTLSVETIQNKYPYVFKNEFESRKVLAQRVKREMFHSEKRGYYELDITYLLTVNSKGEMEHSKYWLDFRKNEFCYSFIIEPYTYNNGQFN